MASLGALHLFAFFGLSPQRAGVFVCFLFWRAEWGEREKEEEEEEEAAEHEEVEAPTQTVRTADGISAAKSFKHCSQDWSST